MAGDAYTDEETARRRDDAVRRALTMAPKPKAAKGEPKPARTPRRLRKPSAPDAPASAGKRGPAA